MIFAQYEIFMFYGINEYDYRKNSIAKIAIIRHNCMPDGMIIR